MTGVILYLQVATRTNTALDITPILMTAMLSSNAMLMERATICTVLKVCTSIQNMESAITRRMYTATNTNPMDMRTTHTTERNTADMVMAVSHGYQGYH